MTLHKKNEQIKKILLKKMYHKIKRKFKIKIEEHDEKLNMLTPPTIFSISENFEETYNFLENLKENALKDEERVFLNLKKIDKITTDTLICLKHIGHYVKDEEKKKVQLCCVLPKNKKLKKIILNSGFYKSNTTNNKDNSGIYEGINVDNDLSAYVTEVLLAKTNGCKSDFAYLYNCLSEMMENTAKHAYEEKNKENKTEKTFWYLSFENFKNKYCFVFFDTGKGIPATINKKMFSDVLNPFKSQSDLLLSALKGEERTRTTQVHRGKGLPAILEMAEKRVSNMKIISSKACYNLNGNNDLKTEFKGTFYYWEIELGGKNEKI